MPLKFNDRHELDSDKVHSCTGNEFIDTFCVGDERADYKDAVVNIFDFARNFGARRIFVGGSFISSKADPSDFDCVIVFNAADDIPEFVDTTIVGNIEFDILFASEDQPQILDAFINLFQTYKNGTKGKPIVEVLLADRLQPWEIRFIPDEHQSEVIKKIYTKRTVIERRKSRGILFSIHGVNTKAFWNSRLGPLASSQGWVFAPFIYGSPVTLLVCPKKRRKVLEAFSEYYHEQTSKYEVSSASIITHSFGTYIIAKYLLSSEYDKFLPCEIDSIVLTGGIVDRYFNWKRFHPRKIGRILNIYSPNDRAVWWMPKFRFIKKYLMREKDGIFGKIGIEGVATEGTPEGLITNKKIEILTHSNVFKPHILTGVIMPFLNANHGVCGNIFTQEPAKGNVS